MAEDRSDIEVVGQLLRKIRSLKFRIKPFVGGGCGALRKKCHAWACVLRDRGCSVLILLHDLDDGKLVKLRAALEESLSPCPLARTVIIIPVQELEAWLLTDPRALKVTFNLRKKPTCPYDPEKIDDPKEFLRDLVWKVSGKTKRYVNTVHNAKIAANLSIAAVRKCKAFCPLEKFWRSV